MHWRLSWIARRGEPQVSRSSCCAGAQQLCMGSADRLAEAPLCVDRTWKCAVVATMAALAAVQLPAGLSRRPQPASSGAGPRGPRATPAGFTSSGAHKQRGSCCSWRGERQRRQQWIGGSVRLVFTGWGRSAYAPFSAADALNHPLWALYCPRRRRHARRARAAGAAAGAGGCGKLRPPAARQLPAAQSQAQQLGSKGGWGRAACRCRLPF